MCTIPVIALLSSGKALINTLPPPPPPTPKLKRNRKCEPVATVQRPLYYMFDHFVSLILFIYSQQQDKL